MTDDDDDDDDKTTSWTYSDSGKITSPAERSE